MEMLNKKLYTLSFILLFVSLSYSQINTDIDKDTEILLTKEINKGNDFDEITRRYYRENPNYFKINEQKTKITLKEIKEENDFSPLVIGIPQKGVNRGVNDVLVTIDHIINIGSKIWDIIKNNAPVSNIENKYAVAYPEGVISATQLSGWSKPKVYIYSFYAENLYGFKTIDVEYRVIFTYGGNYKGKGKYLTAVSIVPTKVDVAWGYNFNMESYVPDSTIVNMGTNENPIAALQLKLTWNISTLVKDSKSTSIYYIEANGSMVEIASPFRTADTLNKLENTKNLNFN